ncbi:Fpg/Nei family DNA glycosylase [Arthrobacter wenxiniae]|uniref:Fpg/Nei family DNA glycosylase n=1 Tax=Arthrobacter wenxiniae TaxID=2713570 RepID=A0A7Y7M166_9MICC|nr:Fpg/Nei family DNA glycosylase [Arthrobacter wenxiniae]
MPELPEIHALVKDLDARIRGRTVARLDVHSISALKTYDPPASALAGQTVRAVVRHGKFLDFAVGDVHFVVHLARAGWIRWRENVPASSGVPGKGPLAARLVFSDGSALDITEAGTRKRVAVYVVPDAGSVQGIAQLGPDPLDKNFTEQLFLGILRAAGRSEIKGLLRQQSIIAGIGNAYSDEILHAARMSPFKPAAMDAAEGRRLFKALRTTLAEAVARLDGLPASELKGGKKSHLSVHGRAGEPCPVCGDVIRQVNFADSSLQYCPTCQTKGKLLADRRLSRLLK